MYVILSNNKENIEYFLNKSRVISKTVFGDRDIYLIRYKDRKVILCNVGYSKVIMGSILGFIFNNYKVRMVYVVGDMAYIDVENVNNEETRYYYDMCKSEFLRKYNSEINFINKKLLPKLAKFFGFEEYYCGGIFSNGEAVYYKVENTNRAKVLRALKEVA